VHMNFPAGQYLKFYLRVLLLAVSDFLQASSVSILEKKRDIHSVPILKKCDNLLLKNIGNPS
jgi:hypothetical protein